jgi:hypothetical protein
VPDGAERRVVVHSAKSMGALALMDFDGISVAEGEVQGGPIGEGHEVLARPRRGNRGIGCGGCRLSRPKKQCRPWSHKSLFLPEKAQGHPEWIRERVWRGLHFFSYRRSSRYAGWTVANKRRSVGTASEGTAPCQATRRDRSSPTKRGCR